MACCFDSSNIEDEYWLLRQKAALLNTGEFPLQFKGPDAEALLDKLFTKDITKVKTGRCGYGLACYEDGGLLVDGVLLRLTDDCFWYAQADGDFYSWARAHATGLKVEISDPRVFVSQVQGPNALNILQAANGGELPDPFGYFAIARVNFAGQEVIVTRTGYTNELGWEFYTEPHHDADAIWQHLKTVGEPFGLRIFGLDAMNVRRIEAGILNAGSDFDHTTTPFDVGLGRFVDEDKADFIGKHALQSAGRSLRLFGVRCSGGEPLINAPVKTQGNVIGVVTAGAVSPYLGCGIGIVRLNTGDYKEGNTVTVGCKDGSEQQAELVEMPFYDKLAEIPRGKLVDIPERT
jgi:aminomethyltransferase